MVADGPGQVRQLRSAAGLTQEQLAELAGVHVRTVRGLETGRITTPRRSTVDLLARALGLDVTGQTRLLTAWGLHDIGPVGDRHPVATRESSSDIERLLARSAQEMVAAAVSETISVGADRRALWRRTEEVLVAVEDGPMSRSLFYDPEEAAVDVDRLHLTDLDNGSVVREWIDDRGSGKVFHVSLGRRLNVGESHLLRYTVDFASARRGLPTEAVTDGRGIGGFLRSPALYLLEVRFDPGAAPRHCEQVFQPRPQTPVQATARLPLNANHATHIALINPKPGGHGIAWRW